MSRWPKTIPLLVSALVAATLNSTEVAAQACLGTGALPGQGYLVGHAAFTEGAWAPGGTLGYNAPGPVTVQAGVDHTLFDNSDVGLTSVWAGLAVEMPNMGMSVCPTATVGYQWLSDQGEFGIVGLDASGVILLAGVSIGNRFESPGSNLAFVPQVSANIVHNRGTLSVPGESFTGSETFGLFSGGMTLAFGNVFLGPSASLTTTEGANPVFGVHIGVAF